MLEWLIQNCATIVIGAILLVAVILAVRSMIKTKKSGGCNCRQPQPSLIIRDKRKFKDWN